MNETNTQTNGYEYIKENANAKQAVMQVYHGESVKRKFALKNCCNVYIT